MSDEFFDKLDETIGRMREGENQKADADSIRVDDATQLVESVAPIVNDYKAKLEKRGIDVHVVARGDYFHFTMKFKDGGHHGFELRRTANNYEIVTLFTNDDGRHMEGHTGQIDLRNFGGASFEKRLQKEIDDFIFYAPRHGGF